MFAHDLEVTTNPHPADAATIPASARGTFHLPPAAEKIADIRLAAAMR